MDDELKVVVTSVLEADESESAQRIAAQLPKIAELINSKSAIKVGVVLNEANIQADAQRITKSISKSLAPQEVDVKLRVTSDAKNMLRDALNGLDVDKNITSAMTKNLTGMQVQIDSINAGWAKVGKTKERLLQLTIAGTDQEKRNVQIIQSYDESGKKVSETIKNVTLNLERQRQEAARIAAQAKADNESRITYLSKQQAILSQIQSTYIGSSSAKPITNTAHLEDLNSKYQALQDKLNALSSTQGKVSAEQRANIGNEIASLQLLVKEYQNIEYVATKLRTKTVVQVNTEQVQKLAEFEEKLKSAGILTDEFQKSIDSLRSELDTAFDNKSLTNYLNSFDRLQSAVEAFKERIATANAEYKKLIAAEAKVAETTKAIAAAEGAGEKAALESTLKLQVANRDAILERLKAYKDIEAYCQGAVAFTQAEADAQAKAAVEAAVLADRAAEISNNLSAVEIEILAVESGMKKVGNAPDGLIEKVKNLKALFAELKDAQTDEAKVAAYERLGKEIAACNHQITLMRKIEGADVFDAKFSSNLEKAKADLATIQRQWSAFKYNDGLNGQFKILTQNLEKVKTQADLTKWTAQFSRFKSEVKAAGLNMQSLGDTLKNNVSKVAQWISATTLLFRAFRALKSAISTVVALDTAMIDLRKTTSATEAEYRQFYQTANETAKQLGQTTEAIISQTAEWSRLGYTMQEAAELAKNSAIFASVSPGMDTSMATDGLVSIIKAYDIDVNDTLDGIISKINAVGNAFAVSNIDIVEAMTRSSSAMSAANNTFDETIALATAAIEITRDASSVGNGLKTLSMRIRGYDEETEEYSDEVAKLTGTIADLTKVASNNNRGISLFEADDLNTYRSTYDILSDIADIWEEMTDKNRAELLEALFGKRQAQIGSAILKNFDQARNSIETMEKSAGSAEKEMEKIYNSLEYKLNALKETWVGVAQNLFQTDDISMVITALTKLSELIDTITGTLGVFGSVAVAGVIAWLIRLRNTVGRPKMTGFIIMIAPTYALVVTRNELSA